MDTNNKNDREYRVSEQLERGGGTKDRSRESTARSESSNEVLEGRKSDAEGTIRNSLTPDNFFQSLDFNKILSGLKRRKFWIAGVVAAFLIIGLVLGWALKDTTYTAYVRLLYNEREVTDDSFSPVQPLSRGTVVQMLTIPSTMEKVIEKLNLDLSAKELREKVVVVERAGSEMMRLEMYGAPNAERAIEVVNTFADVAIRRNVNLYREQAKKTLEDFDLRCRETEKRLASIKKRIEEFQKENRILEPSVEQQAYLENVSEASTRLSQARVQLNEIKIKIENYKSQIEKLPEEVPSQSIENNPIKRRISNTEVALMEAKTRYGPDNPKVLSLERNIEEMRKLLRNKNYEETREQTYIPNPLRKEMQAELVRLEIQKEAAEETVKELKAELKEKRSRFSKMPGKNLEYLSMVQEKNAAQQNLTALQSKRDQLRMAMRMDLADFEVIEYAAEATPYGSKLAQFLPILSLLLGIGGGVGGSLVLELLDPYIRTRKQMESFYNVSCLADIPAMDDLTADNSYSALIPYLREIVDKLPMIASGNKLDAVGFFSAFEGEGKSSLAFNLARYYNSLGVSTLYLDFSPTGNPLVATEGLENRKGLIEYLQGECSWSEIEQGYEGVKFAKVWQEQPEMVELLKNKRMARLWDTVKREYKLIIVESAGMLDNPAALELANIVSYPILLVGSPVTRKRFVDLGLERLESRGVSPVATILNMMDTSFANDFNTRAH